MKRIQTIIQRSLPLVATGIFLVVISETHAQTQPQLSGQSAAISRPLAQTITAPSSVIAVESVGMTVANMNQAIDFYSNVLAFKKISDIEVWGNEYDQLQGLFGVRMRIVKLQLGREVLELTEYLTPKGKPIPLDSRSHDRWFQHIAIVVRDMDRAYHHLRQHNVQYTSTAPQQIPQWNQAAGGIQAFYFKDPDGHNLEIIYFPPGKGDPRWQQPTQQLFLGIDHTAIVIANTADSLAFYRGFLGLQLVGKSLNYGPEQEHLNHVKNARLQISGLRAIAGPGIEFLEYLTPNDGRSRPDDSQANDLTHWQTTVVVKDLEAILQRLRFNAPASISTQSVLLTEPGLGFKKAVLVRDPDGHTLRLVEK